jgi:hypothetical protein
MSLCYLIYMTSNQKGLLYEDQNERGLSYVYYYLQLK